MGFTGRAFAGLLGELQDTRLGEKESGLRSAKQTSRVAHARRAEDVLGCRRHYQPARLRSEVESMLFRLCNREVGRVMLSEGRPSAVRLLWRYSWAAIFSPTKSNGWRLQTHCHQ